MSSGILNNLPYWFRHKIYEESPEREFDFSRAIIPFSKIFKSSNPTDIYSGTENIPFNERAHEFKMIFREEFSELLRE